MTLFLRAMPSRVFTILLLLYAALEIGANDCTKQGRQLQQSGSSSFTEFICPEGCHQAISNIWGTAYYTDDSSVCKAAIHDGRITNAGGLVKVYHTNGLGSYSGSTQNGITSSSYGSWTGSFTFENLCTKQANQLDFGEGTTVKFQCPAGCQQIYLRLWGTVIYTDNSYICAAAIHDGQISDSGGEVTVHLIGGLLSYTGSKRNGMKSKSYGSSSQSFSFGDLCLNSANQLEFNEKSFASFTCPSGCQQTSSNLWGTEVYTQDSYICAAAIHDGVISDSGGTVNVTKLPGVSSYTGSEQNGIISRSYGSFQGSFTLRNFSIKQPDQLDFGDGTSVQFPCPAGSLQISYRLLGTVIYTDNSYICAAAIHDGQISDSGGVVTVHLASGLSFYTGSTQNGVTSKSFGFWPRSFTFSDLCAKQARQLDFGGGSYALHICPPGCQQTSSRLWGTEVYTDDSFVCAAAIHDGVISDSGGTVNVTKLGGLSSYTGSEKNGISSNSYGSWGGSFTLKDLCTKRFSQLDFGAASTVQFPCPADCQQTSHFLWGTEVYTDDSHICAAAIHDGKISGQGGVVTVYLTSGYLSFTGSTQNGINSISVEYLPHTDNNQNGITGESFTFIDLCTKQADQLEFNGGSTTTYICPPGCQQTASHVWGIGVFKDDSYICASAIHEGVMSDSGGRVTVVKLPGQSSYAGKDRNGISSKPYGEWSGSFSFKVPDACVKQGRDLEYQGVVSATHYCPPECKAIASHLWGTDTYTDDSFACAAAFHVGRISGLVGGTISLMKSGVQPSYVGSTRNGVTSHSYASWEGGSFHFSS